MPVPHTSKMVSWAITQSSKLVGWVLLLRPLPTSTPTTSRLCSPTHQHAPASDRRGPHSSPHLPAALWVPAQLRLSNRQVAKAAVTVAASGIGVDLKQAVQTPG